MSRITIVILMIIVMTAVIVPAFAAEEGDVMMADFLLLRIRCPVAGYTIAQRVDAVQRRANDLLVLGGIDLSTVHTQRIGWDVAIYAGGKLLVTVSECDARVNRTTVGKLAKVWMDRFVEIYPKVVPKVP